MSIFILIAIAGIFGQLLLCGVCGFRETFPELLKVDVIAVIVVIFAVLLNAFVL